MLDDQPVRPSAPPPPQRAIRSGPRWWLIVIPLVAVAAMFALAVLLFLLPQSAGPSAGPVRSNPTPTAPSGPARLIPVDSTTVEATASSVLAPVPPTTFVAENTLDGNLKTAWNSNGTAGGGPGTTLTYRFAEPVRLGRVDLANGYQAGADEYVRNQRVKTLTVTTEGTQRTFNIGDSKGFQQLELDFGTTREVTLRIDETYPGSRYNDIAISEVVFHRLG